MNSKNRFIKYLPDRRKLQEYKALWLLNKFFSSQNLWYFNRYSVATAFSVGLFAAWVPIPFQMLLAASIAIVVQANLPIAVSLVWITNPITMPPLYFFAYRVGSWVLQYPLHSFNFELSFSWISSALNHTWQPFLLGCLICGFISAIISNITVRAVWRYRAVRQWQHRSRRIKPKIKS